MDRATAIQLEVMRGLSPAERLHIMGGMCDAMRQLVAAGVGMRNPGWSVTEVEHEVRRIYGALPPETVRG
jgi:hypothetical protein